MWFQALKTNGPKTYMLFIWVSCALSSGVRFDRPAAFCSWVDSLVSSPSLAALPARSGWLLRMPSPPADKHAKRC